MDSEFTVVAARLVTQPQPVNRAIAAYWQAAATQAQK
jgi:hypothetical protein